MNVKTVIVFSIIFFSIPIFGTEYRSVEETLELTRQLEQNPGYQRARENAIPQYRSAKETIQLTNQLEQNPAYQQAKEKAIQSIQQTPGESHAPVWYAQPTINESLFQSPEANVQNHALFDSASPYNIWKSKPKLISTSTSTWNT